MNFRKLEKEDWEQVSEIYRQGIETKNATFQLDIPNWIDWDNGHLQTCRMVAEIDTIIVGWFALSPVSSRCVYGGVAEVSVYVANDFSGQQIGTKLLEKLIEESEKNGIWTLQAGIFPENKGSLKIHTKLGFREIGYREKIGKMDGVWRDTILLERRSNKIGIE
ncbi:MAG: phosphinothricin acetyltransferase [Flammeovirgaceae bacterium]|jgi:phosphinothricin acetyltransferase